MKRVMNCRAFTELQRQEIDPICLKDSAQLHDSINLARHRVIVYKPHSPRLSTLSDKSTTILFPYGKPSHVRI